jgi:uncharacterized protein with beta-barrel porin domain
MIPSALRRRVLLQGTMLAAAVGGYGRRAYAACAPTVAPNYQCSGANVTAQTISANNASVSTAGGFSVNTSNANAITITGDGALTYTDTNASQLISTGTGTALAVISGGDFAGTPGSVTINTNGALSGRDGGIDARNYGTGAVTITANGNVSSSHGLGIYAINKGTAALTVTANGNVSAVGAAGINAINYGTNLGVTTAVGTTVRGGVFGIEAANYGTGAVTITANGNVTGTDGTNGIGITASSSRAGTALSVTTAAGTTVSGGKYGINASNDGTGALIIVANGNVTGGSNTGIQARNIHGSTLSVTTAAGTTVSGGNYGILAEHYGHGALTITANGNVSGGSYSGIFASTYGAGLSVTTAAGTTVSGGTHGIYARNYGTGTLTITANGNVTGTIGDGIFARSPGGSPIAITVGATGTVTSANAFAIETVGAPATVTVAGTVAGSMQIAGPGSTLTFQSGAIYKVFVTPATSSLANVGGTATLGGAAVTASFANGSYISKRYTILTADSISGSFGTLTNLNLPANFHDSLSYDSSHAYLDLALSFQLPASNTLNGNQQAVANTLVGFFNSTGGIPAAFSSLNANGLSQAAGETATGSQATTFNAMNQFMGVMTDPFAAGRSGATNAPAFADENAAASAYASSGKPRSTSEREAYAAIYSKAPIRTNYDPRWSVWAASFGGSQTSDGNAALGSNSSTSRIFGVAAGADYFLSPNTVAGFALAGGGTNFSVVNSGSGRSDLFQAGAFVRHTVGPAYISAALAYGWQDVITNRTVTIAGTDMLRAEFNANAFSGRVEGGYRFVAPIIGGVGITPYAAAQFTTFDLPAYAEQALAGSDAFALNYGAKSVTDPRSELGLRTDKSWAMPDSILTLRGRLAWAHDYDPDRSIGATFQTLPGASFVVNGAAQASDSALVTASVEKKWLNGWSTAATFEGEFSSVTSSYAGKGVVRYQW